MVSLFAFQHLVMLKNVQIRILGTHSLQILSLSMGYVSSLHVLRLCFACHFFPMIYNSLLSVLLQIVVSSHLLFMLSWVAPGTLPLDQWQLYRSCSGLCFRMRSIQPRIQLTIYDLHSLLLSLLASLRLH